MKKEKLILKYTQRIANLQSWCNYKTNTDEFKSVENEIAIYEKFIEELKSLKEC